MTHIWVPKVKIAEAQDAICLHHGLKGFFTMRALNRFGQVKRELTFENLITDLGLNRYSHRSFSSTTTGGGGLARFFVVGTGTAAPTPADTELGNQVASTSSQVGGVTLAPGGEYHMDISTTKQFGLGAINASLTEVGVGPAVSGLWSRALILDGQGQPTAFPVTEDEQLSVTYTLRRVMPAGDFSSSFSLTGDGAGAYDYTVRVSRADGTAGTSNAWGSSSPYFTGWHESSPSAGGFATPCGTAESNTLQAATATGPAGANTSGSGSRAEYVQGSFERGCTYTFGLTDSNYALGIGSLGLPATGNPGANGWQVVFPVRIPKFAGSIQRILTLHATASWGRA